MLLHATWLLSTFRSCLESANTLCGLYLVSNIIMIITKCLFCNDEKNEN